MEFLHFTLVDLVDIILVAAVIYLVFRWIRGSSAINIFIAIIIIFQPEIRRFLNNIGRTTGLKPEEISRLFERF